MKRFPVAFAPVFAAALGLVLLLGAACAGAPAPDAETVPAPPSPTSVPAPTAPPPAPAPTPSAEELAEPPAVEPPAAEGYKRIPLPTLSTQADYPYTVEIPFHWSVRRDIPTPGVVLGPPVGDPANYPEMVLVRPSQVELDDPEGTLANIRANAERIEGWDVTEARVAAAGNVLGILVLSEQETADGPVHTLTLKLPVPAGGSVDLKGEALAEDFERLRSHFEHILLSVRPAETVVEDVEVVRQDGRR